MAGVEQVIQSNNSSDFSESRTLMNIVVEKVMDRFVKPGLTWDMNPDDENTRN